MSLWDLQHCALTDASRNKLSEEVLLWPSGHKGGSVIICAASFSEDMNFVVAFFFNSSPVLWDLRYWPKPAISLKYQGNYVFVCSAAFAKNGSYVVGYAQDGNVRIWDINPCASASARLSLRQLLLMGRIIEKESLLDECQQAKDILDKLPDFFKSRLKINSH